MPTPKNCPHCGCPLDLLYGADKYTIMYQDEHYIKDEDPSVIVCGHCHEELDPSDIEDIMTEIGEL